MISETSEGVEITQKSVMCPDTTQIAIQNNNYSGITPEEASKITINLFMENFPKLQQLAEETAKSRVQELGEQILKRLIADKIYDFTPFSDPDVQYIIYEAQKNYARLGTKEMLSTLTSLVSQRIKCDDNFNLKIIVDKAISIVNLLSSSQLDYLSLTFICKQVKFEHINSIEKLNQHFQYISNTFSLASIQAVPFLNTMNCLELNLGGVSKISAQMYNLEQKETERICPNMIKQIHGDYGTSYIGTILAITNAEAKTTFRFDPTIWIHN